MTIVLFGEDLFTIAVMQSLASHGHLVQALITPVNSGKHEYRSLQTAANNSGVQFVHADDVNDDNTFKLVSQLRPELIICVHLRRILHKKIYSFASVSAINVHPSLLPKYRGLSPQHQALIHGDPETGVTVHQMDEAADTGAIVAQQIIPLTPQTYIYHLQLAMLTVYKELVPEAVRRLSQQHFSPTTQQTTGASWFGPLKEQDRQIDLKKAKFAVYNLIRAVSQPYKGAFYKNITVWTSYIPDLETGARYGKEFPDNGLYTMGDLLLIRLRDGVLLSDDFEIAAS